MAKTKRKWIILDFTDPDALRAQDIPYDGSSSIADNLHWLKSGSILSPRNNELVKINYSFNSALTLKGEGTGIKFKDQNDLDRYTWQLINAGQEFALYDLQVSAGYPIRIANGDLYFNSSFKDTDIYIRKLTTGEALKYDAGLDEFTFDSPVIENEYIEFPNGVRIGNQNTGSGISGSAIAIGNSAGGSNSNNGIIAIGFSALGKAGSARVGCIAIGQNALANSAGGQRCLAIGPQALFNMNNGSKNVAIGELAGYTCASGSDNIFIGYNAGRYETGSNKLFIDNQARTDEATARLNSMIYGEFNATRASQNLFLNANITIRETLNSEGQAIFNSGFGDNDFVINKLTTGEALRYDAGNDLFDFDSPVLISTNGSISKPALAIGSATWGFYRSATQGLKVVIGGQEMMNFDNNAQDIEAKKPFQTNVLDDEGALRSKMGITGSGTTGIIGFRADGNLLSKTGVPAGDIGIIGYENNFKVGNGVLTAITIPKIAGFVDSPDFSGANARTISNYYGAYFRNGDDPTTLTLTNRYGIYIEALTGGASNWGIYSLSANNLLKGLELDGGSITTNKTAPADLDINCGTDKTIRLVESVWDDLPPAPFSSAKIPTSQAPTWTAFISGGTNRAYQFDIDEYLFVAPFEIIHKYKEGTDLSLHLHWATGQGTDGTDRAVKWEVTYTVANGSSAFPTETTVSQEITIPASTPANSHIISTIATISGSSLAIGAYIICTIKRITATGTAPSNDPFGLALGIHIEQDTIGSRQMISK
jgi:hypothetical protein